MRRRSGIPFELGIIRSHYVGRTFIQPCDRSATRREAQAQRQPRAGRRQEIVLIDDFDRARHDQPEDRPDDARCRRERGAYARRQPADRGTAAFTASTRPSAPSCSPRGWTSPRCAEFIHADSLAFVSIDGLYRAVGEAGRDDAAPQYCDACFTGEYPTAPDRPGRTAPRERAAHAARQRRSPDDRWQAASRQASRSSPARAAGSARRPPRRSAAAGAHVVLTARTAGPRGVEERSTRPAAPRRSRRWT